MIPGSANPLLLASAAGSPAPSYQIERSLRFNSSDSAYLSRTPSVAGNRKTWTWAGWVKRSALGGDQVLFGACPNPGGADNDHYGLLISGDALWSSYYTGSQVFQCVTSAVLRDTSAWYHITVAFDTAQATASNRIKIYVNGSLQSLSTANYPSLNYDGQINSAIFHSIGKHPRVSLSYLSGYLADVHFIDGQALDPTSFGEFDTNGVWQPKAYTSTYPGNSFHLPFSDNSTAAALGTDTSGAGNNWTVNNISVAAGAGNDSLVDTPTNYGVDDGLGGSVRGNYATLNPLAPDFNSVSTNSLSNGNLQAQQTISSYGGNYATFAIPSSGKWYFEVTYQSVATASNNQAFGIRTLNNSKQFSFDSPYTGTGTVNSDGVNDTSVGLATAGDIYGLAVDCDSLSATMYRNGSTLKTYTMTSGVVYFPFFRGYNSGISQYNFGQRPFAYPAPSGFKALCTTNLPDPVVAKPSEVMDVVTYTGNGGTQVISSLNFSPDLAWFKSRSSAAVHAVIDSVRGRAYGLITNNTDAESTSPAANDLVSFDSNGFTLGPVSQYNSINQSGTSIVAWAWDAGSSTVTNTQGSITSQVRANASAGFSIVSWTGTSALATVGHGLGVAPSFIITKRRSGVSNWDTYHVSIGNNKGLSLNTTDAAATSADYWNNTSPTSDVFTVNAGVNPSGVAMIAYCFAPVAGYSAFGSYVGNGSADGPFVFTGMRPKWILVKRTDSVSNWTVWDAARNTFNFAGNSLYPNLSNAEDANTPTGGAQVIDILSNGFKLRDTGGTGQVNASGGTYLYCAFAESPFQFSRAR